MLALIAGEGRLPDYVARSLNAPLTIAALEGTVLEGLTPNRTFRVEQIGSFIADLKENGVTEVCFAGSIPRPRLDPSAVDAATMPLVPQMMQALQMGDDAALRTVLSFFEDAGLTVRGAHEIVPSLLPAPGVPTRRKPDKAHERDANRGATVLAALGAADVGQSTIIAGGQALAVEATPGTDWMLESIVAYRGGRTGGLLYKAPKPEQDRRVDMPTIGPDTVKHAAHAGLDGIVIAAGGVLAIDIEDIVARLDARNMILWVRE